MQDFTLPRAMRRDGMIQRIAAFLARLPEDKAWRISVEQAKSTRSNQQNRYLHGVAYKRLSDATGYELEEIRDFMLGKYFGEREIRVPRSTNYPRGIKMVPRRTTTTNEAGARDVLAWDAFAEYVAFIQRFGAEHGIDIPDPDQNWRLHEQQEAA
jgi:hypothetical protein